MANVEKKVKKQIRKANLEGTLGIAFSGGKDSTVTLYLLNELLTKSGVDMVAITVDEGIRGYRDNTLKTAAKLVEKLGVRWHVVSFEKQFGVRIDQIEERPCTLCGILRRSLLNRVAKELGVSTLVTGHNLDDEAQTVLMNYLRGDILRLLRLHHVSKVGLIPRMKPLKYVPEKEVALYAILKAIPIDLKECKFASGVFRAEVRELLNELEFGHPGTKYSLVRGQEKLLQLTQTKPFELAACAECGEPSVKELCQSCDALANLQVRASK